MDQDNGTKRPGRACFALTAIGGGLKIGVKMLPCYLRFKRKAKKAGKVFQGELEASGMDPQLASALTEEYLKSSHLLRNMGLFDFNGMGGGE